MSEPIGEFRLLLAIPPAVAYGFALPKALRNANMPIVVSSAGLALMNITAEVIFWRGVFVREFSGRRILGWLYPTLAFGL